MQTIPGIKDRKDYGDIKKLKKGDMLDFVRQLHLSRNRHHDLRIGDKKRGLYSWATRKELPTVGKPIQLFRQPMHTHQYKDFEGEIFKGYGKGTVKKEEEVKALITKDEGHLSFTTSEQSPKRYAIIPLKKDKEALLVRANDPQDPGVKKPTFSSIPPKEIKSYISRLQQGDLVQPKVDGALSLFHLLKNRNLEVLSHRTSKRTGSLICHTERFFGRRPVIKKLPKDLTDTVLLGEMYGEQNGKVIPLQTLGGILNSNLDKSLNTQRREKINLKAVLFDVQKLHGRDTSKLPYETRLRLLEKIKPYLNQDKFELPETVKGPKAGLSLLDKIRAGNHHLTTEGLIVRTQEGKDVKAKLFTEHNVHIRDIFRGEGKYEGKAAGGFEYSLTTNGPVVGKCGTGFNDKLRIDMWKNPQQYLGRVARISAQGQFGPTGAYRVPSLIALDESK